MSATIINVALIVVAVALGFLWQQTRTRLRQTHEDLETTTQEFAQSRERFAGVVDADEEEARVRNATAEQLRELEELSGAYAARKAEEEAHLQAALAEEVGKIEQLRSSYAEKRAVYERLLQEVAVFDERLSFAEMGVYEPHFEFTDSEEYKEQIRVVREEQKAMVAAKTAVFCRTEWRVDGSRARGETMTNRNIRLTLRAFNNECEAAIANTRWNNVNSMEKRILRAQEQIDKMNSSNSTIISPGYVQLKLKELYLTYEYREKLKAEREERAEAARLAREEQKLLRDLEKAEEEEARYARLLEKAKAESEATAGPQLGAFQEQVALLEKELAVAQAKAERAKAMAERTRSGYVYVISNIGSFGDGVVKIGLTRRLDPVDRVRELGDASVPFTFDTHAIIYSDDAPTLEHALHAEFESARINAQNMRKEFFRASLEDVELAVKRLAPEAPFFKDIEAQEYRETLARRQNALEREAAMEAHRFPSAL